ncbi:hypothetical protein [Limnoglobus roseus]|uniref:DUF5658 domain-containing protein n=1 Tax=Limnoglobus roseus TaxID=2598579 RepID=A0A5C1AQ74_9BACT|nr:hypothetical protein [Limnoglobus roseus]QEL20337.1 hypothetical protein PX52LOC_07430 [Limnoglobus roseus]
MTRWPLALLAVSVYQLDIALTFAGQPPAYWAGDYVGVDEVNPLAHALLAVSPWLFLALAFVWAAGFTTVLLTASDRWATVIAHLLAGGHTLGAASWLLRHGWPGMIAAGLLAFAVSYALTRFTRTDVCSREGKTLK